MQVEVSDAIPKGEIWFFYGYKIVGKIINIKEPYKVGETNGR